MQPFLILETGQPTPSMRRYGSFAHWIRVAAGLARDAAVVVDVEAGQALPTRAGFAGVIVTGSAAMVTEHRDWSERSATWLHEAAHAGLPLLGICYGHQLLAHALGGQVGNNPNGREMGTVGIDLHPQAHSDPLFAGLPVCFPAQATHLQSVLQAPAGVSACGGCNFIPNSAPPICVAISVRGRTHWRRKAAMPSSWRTRSVRHRWHAKSCAGLSATHGVDAQTGIMCATF